MSGFEIAGLVLASVPILLAVLKSATSTSLSMLGYRAAIERYHTNLATEGIIFRNIMLFLLQDIVSSEQLQSLLEDSKGQLWQEIWQEKAVIECLENKLKRDSYLAVLKVVAQIEQIFQNLSNKIGTEMAKKGQRTRLILRIALLEEKLDKLVDELRNQNRSLEKLIEQAKYSVLIRAKSRINQSLSGLDTLRKEALLLYHAVLANLTCDCTHHEAGIIIQGRTDASPDSLDLLLSAKEPRQTVAIKRWSAVAARPCSSPEKPEVACRSSNAGPVASKKGKQVSFGAPSKRVAVPLESTLPAKQILDFCAYSSETLKSPPLRITGRLIDADTIFQVAQSTTVLQNHVAIPVSIQEWLLGSDNSSLSLRDRLCLAASTATAVLALWQTPWLQSYPQAELLHYLKLDFKIPAMLCVSTQLRPSASVQTPELVPSFVKYPVLCHLGILLIEMLFRKPIGELQEKANYTARGPCSQWETTFGIADGLLKCGCVADEIGPDYAQVIECCVYGQLSTVELGARLGIEDKNFRKAVHQEVVGPLYEIIERLRM